MDYKEFEPLFGAWAEKFKPFIESKEMDDIYTTIKNDAFEERDGKFYRKEYITPADTDTFRVFKETPPDKLKSIWYLMDPYPKRYKDKKTLQATGIAMDCSNSPDGTLQPSLEKFYDAMEKDLATPVERSPSLSYLAEQGVMMLNTDLTCKLNKTGSHEGLWDKFQKFFLEEIMYNYTGIVYVLAGKTSHKMEKYINPLGNYIFKIEHPVSASYKNTDWNCGNIFSKTNKILHDNNKFHVFWDRSKWELPF